MKRSFEQALTQCPVVAILRGITPEEVPGVCDILDNAGIKLLEIPLNSPDAVAGIARAVKHCSGRQMVGAGTVLTARAVKEVAQAGGQFIISPNTNGEVIRETKRLGLISIPGFFTAGEGFDAVAAGADYLKLFPALLGPGYIKDLRAVLPVPIMAVGGVDAKNIPGFLEVCCGVGIGSALYKPGKPLSEIGTAARDIVRAAATQTALP